MFLQLWRVSKLFLFLACFAVFTSMAFSAELPENTIVLEAEAGEMDKNVTIVEMDDAAGGNAIDSAPEAITTHEIQIPKAGKWYLWARLWCPDGSKDSYWFGMDETTPVPDDGGGQIRIYSAAGDSVNTAAQPFNIWFWDFGMANGDAHSYFDVDDPGTYTFWSKGREAGTVLDQILLTMDEDFSPEEAFEGQAIALYEAVYPEEKLAATWGNLKISGK